MDEREYRQTVCVASGGSHSPVLTDPPDPATGFGGAIHCLSCQESIDYRSNA